jgi:DNA-binding NarL/FixJ family response regulator
MSARSAKSTPPTRSAKGVLLVDDHPIIRKGIRSLLQLEPDLSVCGEAESAGEALQAMDQHAPDVVVVDISLKGTDGLELTKSIRARHPQVPILIVSMHDEGLYAERALRAGANGYVMKQEVADHIVSALRQVLKGETYVSEAIRQKILMGIRGRREAQETSPVDRLSDRELEVFRLIGSGYGTRQISERLHLSIKTIETYRSHLKEKLNLESASELVRHAVQWVEQRTG